jgi:hypothetical protein
MELHSKAMKFRVFVFTLNGRFIANTLIARIRLPVVMLTLKDLVGNPRWKCFAAEGFAVSNPSHTGTGDYLSKG